MHAWSLSVVTPLRRLDMARRMFVRHGPILAALGGLTATLATGAIGAWAGTAPLPRPDSAVLNALMVIAGIGALAWHFARLTILPLANPRFAALIPALTAAMLAPGMGLTALLAPAILSLWAAWRYPEQRLIALTVQCGALAATPLDMVNAAAACSLTVMMLGIAWFLAAKSLSGAANDNPSMERTKGNNWLPGAPACDNKVTDSIPGKWGVSNVQQ